ncbi:MAG: ASCH domain-containing protein [Turicibacter sp.]|nr:ASCH domain-containing protein [Turicibacter sp.]
MNEQAQKYWNEFWQGKTAPTNVIAEQFGWEYTEVADELADLIIRGIKTATCSGHAFYEADEPLPAVGDYSIVLNSKDEPVAMIKIVEVTLTPMNEVTEAFARAEGEGDLSYEYWYEGHKEVFTRELAELGMAFTEDMLLVCERFELVDVK